MRVIVGLGNPGPDYSQTRHNAGFMTLDALAGRWSLVWNRQNELWDGAHVPSAPCELVKPQTFMNNSGDAVEAALDATSAANDDLLVVVDDIHLGLGDVRLRAGGSDGGHNGLASISLALEGVRFARLRIGVGEPPPDQPLISFVLSPFDEPELPIIEQAIDEAALLCESFAEGGYKAAADRYAARSLPPESGS